MHSSSNPTKILGENLAAFTSNPTKTYWDEPTIVGASVLELAKFGMYKFHHVRVKTKFDSTSLFRYGPSPLEK